MTDASRSPPLDLLIAAPRGFCAGVDRAIRIVELAIEKYGAPVYVRHEIVHNHFVVDSAEGQGRDLRRGAGRGARRRAGGVLARTACPRRCRPRRRSAGSTISTRPARWSRKVHRQAERLVAAGRHILFIGHRRPSRGDRHLRPGARGRDDAGRDRRPMPRRSRRADPANLAFLTQTTLSVDDTADDHRGAQAPLSRDPGAARPRTSATPPRTARRRSRRSRRRATLVLVIGAPNSSNSLRLVEVAERAGHARAADPARRRHRLRLARRRRARSASPPAPRPPRCWCAKWSTGSPNRFDGRPSARSRRRARTIVFKLPRGLDAAA